MFVASDGVESFFSFFFFFSLLARTKSAYQLHVQDVAVAVEQENFLLLPCSLAGDFSHLPVTCGISIVLICDVTAESSIPACHAWRRWIDGRPSSSFPRALSPLSPLSNGLTLAWTRMGGG